MNEFEKKSLESSKWTAWGGILTAIFAFLALNESIKTNKATLERLDKTLVRMDREREQAILPSVSLNTGVFTAPLGPHNTLVERKDGEGGLIPLIYARNVGTGAATDLKVTWTPYAVYTASSGTVPDKSYALPKKDTWDLDPTSISASESSRLYMLPQFVMQDHEAKQLRRVRGVVETYCHDITGMPHRLAQEFTITFNYNVKPPTLTLKISSDVSPEVFQFAN